MPRSDAVRPAHMGKVIGEASVAMERMEPFVFTVEALRARQCIKWTRYATDVLPAWVADMDFAVAEPVQAAVTRLVDCQDYGYGHRTGEASLATAFATRMQERFGWTVDPERVQTVT